MNFSIFHRPCELSIVNCPLSIVNFVGVILMSDRKAEFSRKTSETDVSAFLNIDGTGNYDIDTGIGFLIICSSFAVNMVF